MARYQFQPGSIFSYGEEQLTFLQLADDEADTHVFQRPNGRAFEMASDEVQREMAAGRLCFVPNAQRRRPRRIDAITANESDEATGKWRNRFVTKWEKEGMPSLSVSKLQPVIEQTMREVDALPHQHPDRLRRAPSPRTVMRWIRSCQNGHGVLSDLYPQGRLSGNRKPRISDDIREILDDAIWGDYLTESRPTVHTVWKKMCGHIDALNEQRARRRWPLLEKIAYSSMLRAINQLSPFTIDFHRLGQEATNRKWGSIGTGYVTDRANQRWQIDHTPCDVYTVSEEDGLLVGRPYLTIIIDVHTRMIMSAVFSYSVPDEGTVLEALNRAIRGMGQRLKQIGIETEYAPNGRPEVLYSDNGAELHSEAVKRACEKLRINQEFAPRHRPWFKGVIERAFRTISRSVFHQMPGTSGSSPRDRGGPDDPAASATLTIREVERRFWEFVLGSYQSNYHQGLRAVPAAVWKLEMKKSVPPPLNAVRVNEATMYRTGRIARRDGIEFKGLLYGFENVVELRDRRRAKDAIPIIVDPDDLTYITAIVDDEATNQHKHVRLQIRPDQRKIIQGKSLEEYRLRLALERSWRREGLEYSPEQEDRIVEGWSRGEGLLPGRPRQHKKMAAEAAREKVRSAAQRKKEFIEDYLDDEGSGWPALEEALDSSVSRSTKPANLTRTELDAAALRPKSGTGDDEPQRPGAAEPDDDLAKLRRSLGIRTADHRLGDSE